MKRFLYLSPYFPPQTRVGALRPLKFARHLPEQGWAPVVLADLRPGDDVDAALYEAVPETTEVVFRYSRQAPARIAAFERGEGRAQGSVPRERWAGAGRALRRAVSRVPAPSPEWLPLGEHSPRMWHALQEGRKILARGDCRAIVVNADPYAACLVGRQLGREHGLPVIHDLRDPWSLCTLRRPQRPLPQRRLVDAMERWCVEDAAKVVLNTETALADYRGHYRDLPEGRFACIRNHGDRELIFQGSYEAPERFTVLFLGTFRRFVEGRVLVEVLAELSRGGLGPRDLAMRVTGRLPFETRELARSLGVEAMLEEHPFVPYREVGTFMETADLLVSLCNPTQQRIPAKIYDYAISDRPMLVVCDNPELDRMLAELEGVRVHPLDDVRGIAESVVEEIRSGRRRTVDRSASGLDSRTASEKLARILDEVTAGR